ncbi:MAG: hypothetical protein B7Y07_02880 [Halothiobacillus sp. 24-54-40]|jgi:hypothetical protein|nr:MAG: hypothetical protein B7X12_09270 [Halothiobacillus sp. 20-53-49]OYY31341.1 MAG: hypothetical protein B7Y58_11355 [Halothiobacillus sp. 35-54-62]OYY55779.1 MAG: hypothetical protein B7Y53_03180 [Halothiobacillus sp. 28-55-5]OYZ87812.1 MAG: hypothetical protein B7Y07_02880 [Halothiobacillus sp. 24-54-40]OZA81280.1 MAG: hypothetical protein B7X64_02460 [Halothiobacillus sp. 39-53-45]HQS01998.1 hypothetical protein [Halothiobacillus sp.]
MNTQTLHPLIRRALLGGALITTLGLSACAVYPTGYGYGNNEVVAGPVVRYAPPPARVEVVGVAPFFGAVWLPGNWVWRDRWVWNEGRWGNPPHPNARWAPGRWDHDGRDNWRWHDGRWR